MIFVTIGGQVPLLQQTGTRSQMFVEGVLLVQYVVKKGLLRLLGLGRREEGQGAGGGRGRVPGKTAGTPT